MRVRAAELALATGQLASMLAAGVPIARAVETLGASHRGGLSEVMTGVTRDLRSGIPLHHALSRHPCFGSLFVTMVRAGENSGALVEVLERMADLLERQMLLARRFWAAVTYPAVCLIAGVAVLALVGLVILPMLLPMFEQLDTRPPPVLELFLRIVRGLTHPVFLLVIALLAVNFAVYLRFWLRDASRSRALRRDLERRISDMPLVGPFLMRSAQARALFMLGIMLQTGFPLHQAMGVAAEGCGNPRLESALGQALQDVLDGATLSQALRNWEVFPSLAIHLVAAGELSGRMDMFLGKLSEMLEEEADLRLNAILAAVQPITLGLIGLLCGGCCLIAFLPLVSLLGQL